MAQDLHPLVEVALNSDWNVWEEQKAAEEKLIKVPWEGIRILAEKLAGCTSLDEQAPIISLMYTLAWRADTEIPVPDDLPVRHVCLCLEMNSEKIMDQNDDRKRLQMLNNGVPLLGKLNHPDSVLTLLKFTDPIVSGYDLSFDRLSEFAISSLVDISGSASDNELHRKNVYNDELRNRIYLEQSVKDAVFDKITQILGNGEDIEDKLKILRHLNEERVIAPMLDFMGDNFQCYLVLTTMHEQQYPELLEYCENAMDEEVGISAPYRIIGKEGGEKHILPLVDKLRKFARLDGPGYRDSRDWVEGALVNLRAHSKQTLELIYAEDNNGKGFQNSIKRVLKKISEAENEKPRASYVWRGDLFSWRTETFEADPNLEYPFQILSDDHIIKIYNRQPLTYEELMDFEIGAYKVNKYGSEILAIVRKNQPSIAEEDVQMGPWQLPIIIRDLLTIHLNVVDWPFEEWDDDTNSAMMKGLDAHTKGQLRKLARSKNPSYDEDIVEKVLDMVIKGMEIEGLLVKAGQKRGVRYALLNKD